MKTRETSANSYVKALHDTILWRVVRGYYDYVQ